MTAVMFGIAEFETGPEAENIVDGKYVYTWRGKRSVDLTWVSSASPFENHTAITMAGSGTSFPINIEYRDFMSLWISARAAKQ